MGDFGLAVMTREGDPLNPDRYQGPGTQGYFAPVSRDVLADVHVADMFRRSRFEAILQEETHSDCPLIPTSGLSV